MQTAQEWIDEHKHLSLSESEKMTMYAASFNKWHTTDEKPTIDTEVLCEFTNGQHDVCVYKKVFNEPEFTANSMNVQQSVLCKWKYIN